MTCAPVSSAFERLGGIIAVRHSSTVTHTVAMMQAVRKEGLPYASRRDAGSRGVVDPLNRGTENAAPTHDGGGVSCRGVLAPAGVCRLPVLFCSRVQGRDTPTLELRLTRASARCRSSHA